MISEIQELYHKTENTVSFFRGQDFYMANSGLKEVTGAVARILEHKDSGLADSLPELTEALKNVMQAAEAGDEILTADLLQLQFLPILRTILEEYAGAEPLPLMPKPETYKRNLECLQLRGWENAELVRTVEEVRQRLEKGEGLCYQVEPANTTDLTLKGNTYFHSNADPWEEAEQLADRYCDEKHFAYVLFGMGLGYPAQAILQKDERYTLRVMESNPTVLALALLYQDLSELLLNPRFTLEAVTEENILSGMDSEREIFLIHYPSLLHMDNGRIRERLSNYFMGMNSMFSLGRILDTNFYYNCRNNDADAWRLSDNFRDRRVAFLGGGPSLNDSLELVKTIRREGGIITCASTVYRGLLSQGICPDYVYMIDGLKQMVDHVKGIDATGSSLIYLCTASYEAVREFAGPKYYLLQKDYEPAEQLAKAVGLRLIQTGGSVSTAAFDYLLQQGCKEIVTIGLDLAYTDGRSHAFEQEETGRREAITVESIDGKKIPTTRNLSLYHSWLERRIADRTPEERKTTLTNYGRGARILGMDNILIGSKN